MQYIKQMIVRNQSIKKFEKHSCSTLTWLTLLQHWYFSEKKNAKKQINDTMQHNTCFTSFTKTTEKANLRISS